MRAAVALSFAFVATSFAGCLGGEDIVPQLATEPLTRLLGFADAVALEQDSFGAEPNLAVLPDGTLFIAAVAGSQDRPNHETGAAWLWRSTDDGATWEVLRKPDRQSPLGDVPFTRKPFGSSDADVVTSPDGWVYYSDWWNYGAPVSGTQRAGNYLVERSNDGGATWASTSLTIDETTSIDRQWLVAGADGLVGLFYASFHFGENNVRAATGQAFVMSIRAAFSHDHGATWGDTVFVVPPEDNVGLQIAHPRITSTGAIVMPYAHVPLAGTYWRDPGSVRLAVSEDDGATWAQQHVADAPEGFDNLWAVQGAADAAGNVFVAYAARVDDDHMNVFLTESADLGETWSTPQALGAAGLHFLPWVAARGDRHVAVGWYGGATTGDPVEADDDAAWFAFAYERVGEVGSNVTKVRAEAVKTGPVCPRGAACPGDRELLDYVSLEFNAAGVLHYAFAVSEPEDGGGRTARVKYAQALVE